MVTHGDLSFVGHVDNFIKQSVTERSLRFLLVTGLLMSLSRIIVRCYDDSVRTCFVISSCELKHR